MKSDNGTQFTSKEFKQFVTNLNIEHRKTSIYFPRSNGLVEKFHISLKGSLIAMCKDSSYWENKLDTFLLYYNSSIHRATGYAPSLLFFGRPLSTPFHVHIPKQYNFLNRDLETQFKFMDELHQDSQKNQEKLFLEYNKNKKHDNIELQVGDTVYHKFLTPQGALGKKFKGPYLIKGKFRNQNYLLKSICNPDEKEIKLHISKLFKVPPLKNYLSEDTNIETKVSVSPNESQNDITHDKENCNQPSTSGYNLRPRKTVVNSLSVKDKQKINLFNAHIYDDEDNYQQCTGLFNNILKGPEKFNMEILDKLSINPALHNDYNFDNKFYNKEAENMCSRSPSFQNWLTKKGFDKFVM